MAELKKYEVRVDRLSLSEHPLAPGSAAVIFTENAETGKSFSNSVQEILDTVDIKKTILKNDILDHKYWIQIELKSELTEEDWGDIIIGMSAFDKASIEYRVARAENEMGATMEYAKRMPINVRFIGMEALIGDYTRHCIKMGNTFFIDLVNEKIENIQLVTLVDILQEEKPTVFGISIELANKLTDKDFKKTPIGQFFDARLRSKNVFAPTKGLENLFVRAF